MAIFIPTLSFWDNKNTWYGSLGQARFFLAPEEGEIKATLWRGPLTLALSEVLATNSFPQTQAGLEALAQWLEEQSSRLTPEN